MVVQKAICKEACLMFLSYFNLKNLYVAGMDHSQEEYETGMIRVVTYDRLDQRPIYIHAELLLKSFYQALQVLPLSSKVCICVDCWLSYSVNCVYLRNFQGIKFDYMIYLSSYLSEVDT